MVATTSAELVPYDDRRAPAEHVVPASAVERRRERARTARSAASTRTRRGRCSSSVPRYARLRPHDDAPGDRRHDDRDRTRKRRRSEGRLTRAALLRRAGLSAARRSPSAAASRPAPSRGLCATRGRGLRAPSRSSSGSTSFPPTTRGSTRWAARWGERNDVEVEIDRVPYTRLPALAAAEAKAGKGHDIFGFLSPPAAYEDDVLDHTDVVAEVERAVGPTERSAGEAPTTRRRSAHFGISHGFVPSPVLWRHDLWASIGESPASWDHVRSAAPKLRELGHPIGIGQSGELDSNVALTSLLMCFGSFLQTETNVPAIDTQRDRRRGAVHGRSVAERSGPPRLLLERRLEQPVPALGRGLARDERDLGRTHRRHPGAAICERALGLAGPGRPQGAGWRSGSTPTSTRSGSSRRRPRSPNGSSPTSASTRARRRRPPASSPTRRSPVPAPPMSSTSSRTPTRTRRQGKYSVLTTVALRHTRNAGWPGTANAAVMEALNRNLVPYMFARVSLGKATPEESVAMTA